MRSIIRVSREFSLQAYLNILGMRDSYEITTMHGLITSVEIVFRDFYKIREFTQFSYAMGEDRVEKFVATSELFSENSISSAPQPPGTGLGYCPRHWRRNPRTVSAKHH
jgi:hypothetical protein